MSLTGNDKGRRPVDPICCGCNNHVSAEPRVSVERKVGDLLDMLPARSDTDQFRNAENTRKR